MTLVLIRHGSKVHGNGDSRYLYPDDSMLDTSGHELSYRIGESLSQMYGLYPTKIYTSPFLRTRQTTENLISGWSDHLKIDQEHRWFVNASEHHFDPPIQKSVIVEPLIGEYFNTSGQSLGKISSLQTLARA